MLPCPARPIGLRPWPRPLRPLRPPGAPGAAAPASLPLLALAMLLGAGCGRRAPCADVATSCLAVALEGDAALGALREVSVELRGAYAARQIVPEAVRLPADVEIALPDLGGRLEVLVSARADSGAALAGAAAAAVAPGRMSAVEITLDVAGAVDAACGAPCPLGCDAAARRCYAPRPSNLPAPRGIYLPDPPPPPVEIDGTAYLDTAACALSDGLNPIFPGRYRAQLTPQDRGPPICVVGVTALTLLPGARLVVFSGNDAPSTPAAAILSLSDIRVAGTIDGRGCLRDRAPGHGAGPGGYWGAHGASYSQVGRCGGGDGDEGAGRPGGGGGAHGTAGGRGGDRGAGGGAGGAPAGEEAITPLRGGCGGGFPGGAAPPGEGGGGGGAIQLWAAGAIQIDGGGAVDVSGCGARAGGAGAGGAGGGAGGAILLEAGELRGGGALVAFGGGGAGGDQSGAPGDARGGGAGGRPQGGPAGGRGAGDEAAARAGLVPAEPGGAGAVLGTLGGGGGGGLGRVRLNVAERGGFTGLVGGTLSTALPPRD